VREPGSTPKKRADSQLSGLAGELFVAAELLKRDIQTSVTFGNAKSIDLLAHNAATGRTFTIQVKSLRSRNFFPISGDSVQRDHVYVFVVLNKPGQPVEYFIVPGHHFIDHPGEFGDTMSADNFPGLRPPSSESLQG
jgi:hypothetical protein